MRPLLFLLLAGCSAPFAAALERSDSGAPDAVVQEGGPTEGDGGGEGDALADGDVVQVDPALTACVAYYRAYATGCVCRSSDAGTPCNQQWNDAGCVRADLGHCEPACGWDGGAQDYDKFCTCISACLGQCAPTNGLYFACAVSNCSWQTCP